jgi:hypothetical protein
MSADGSMAAWCVPREDAPNSTAEIHLNYWRIAGDATFVRKTNGQARDFAEVGVLLAAPATIERIHIYLPGEAWDLEDCGPRFNDPQIAQGIFNEVLTSNVSGPPGPQRTELLRQDQTLFCRVHRFLTNAGTIHADQLTKTSLADGTLLTITRQAVEQACANLPVEGRVYFRLRAFVTSGKPGPFIKVVPPHDRLFQSGYTEVEYVDFRFNEARTLPPEVEQLMRRDPAGSRVGLKLIAFLAAIPVLSDLTAATMETHKKRLLEHELWNAYVPSGIPEGMVVYHWKKEHERNVEDFSAFVKMQTRRSGKGVLFAYLAIAFTFGVLGNLAASAIWYWAEGKFLRPAAAESRTMDKAN